MNIRMISVLLSVVVLSSSCGTKGRTKKGDKPTDSRSEIPDNKVPETTGRVGDCCDCGCQPCIAKLIEDNLIVI